MASSCPHRHWEPPHSTSTPLPRSTDWRTFYTRALDYLDTLDIKPDQADDNWKGWKQLMLMFEGKDRQALQTLIDNRTAMLEDMKKPRAALDAIMTTIKSEEHFWAHWDEHISDTRQQPGEGIHVSSQHISNLITKCRFPHPKTQEMLKIMVLQHTVWYHEARDWISQQDQSQLTYQALLSYCKLLESRCKQYQKARERGHADLASITQLQHQPFMLMPSLFPTITAATSVATPTQMSSACPRDNSAMHAAALTTLQHCANNREDDRLADKLHTELSILAKEA